MRGFYQSYDCHCEEPLRRRRGNLLTHEKIASGWVSIRRANAAYSTNALAMTNKIMENTDSTTPQLRHCPDRAL